MPKVKICFWGVRGSTPASSLETLKYGGNTPCVEILTGRDRLICDAGTGLRLLGWKLEKTKKKIKAAILLSHLHWDHIAGLPFFEPLNRDKNLFEIIGPKSGGQTIKKWLIRAFSPPYFPVSLRKVNAKLKFKNATDRPFRYGKVWIHPFWLVHPGGALGWRFKFPGGKSLIYVSDNEPAEDAEKIIQWAKGADIMIHDAQYTPAEYRRKKGWGHSPFTYPVKLAVTAGVKKLILSHFDPLYGDQMLESMLLNARKQIKKGGITMKCELAREGKVIQL